MHWEIIPSIPPVQLFNLHDEFLHTSSKTENSNFLKGVKWSPDGISWITAADDNTIRIYDLPQEHYTTTTSATAATTTTDPVSPALRIPAGELVYDYSWYSCASASEPISFCFALACRSHPIRIFDASTGDYRCSYCPYTSFDELSPAYSVSWTNDGAHLCIGCHSSIHVFDVNRPGRDSLSVIETHRKKQDGQPGIISCMAHAAGTPGYMAAGSFSGIAAVYDVRTSEQLFLLEGHTGGVTHVRFSADGMYLYTGARKDNAIYCWDARYGSGAVYTIQRYTPDSNQKIFFDIEPYGRFLASGGEDGLVRVFDLRDGRPAGEFAAANDVVNGCEFHPLLPMVATASGQRRFYAADSDSCDDSDGCRSLTRKENCLGCWKFSITVLPAGDKALERTER